MEMSKTPQAVVTSSSPIHSSLIPQNQYNPTSLFIHHLTSSSPYLKKFSISK